MTFIAHLARHECLPGQLSARRHGGPHTSQSVYMMWTLTVIGSSALLHLCQLIISARIHSSLEDVPGPVHQLGSWFREHVSRRKLKTYCIW